MFISSRSYDFVSIDSDYVGCDFDVGHFFCVGEDPTELVDELKEYTTHYHLEDIPADRTHEHTQLGDGALDIDGFLSAVERTGYDGFVTVELYPYEETAAETAREAMAYLDEHGWTEGVALARGDLWQAVRGSAALVRVPNLFTAPPDILLGAALAGAAGASAPPAVIAAAAVESMLFYAGGTALNDYFDTDRDAVERPERPIPSGRVLRRLALVLGLLFLAGASQ